MKRSMRAKAHAMDHDRTLTASVLGDILQAEVERHLEVQLNRAALPGASEAVAQMEVNLRAVERAVALVDDIRHLQLLQRLNQAVGRCLPVLVAAHAVLRTGGQLDEILKSELAVHLIDQIDDADDLVRNLIRTS